VVEATEQANAALVVRQTEEVKASLWADLPSSISDNVARILRHQMLDPLLRHRLIENPKDYGALDRWVAHVFRIAHLFSREPWAEQAEVLRRERLDSADLLRLNAAMRDAEFV